MSTLKELCQQAYECRVETVKTALETDPSLATKKDENERQLLHWACSGGCEELVVYLLNVHHTPLDEPDDSGWTPLIIAASAGRDNIVNELLRRFANTDNATNNGCTALHYAASKNRHDICESLISSSCDVDVQETLTSATPLHRAASKGNSKVVRLLLDSNCKMDLQDAQGNTALHLACEEERTEIAEMLQRNGASLHIQNKEEKTAIDVAPPYLKRRLLDA